MYILFESYRNIDAYFKQRMMLLGGKGAWIHCEIIFNEKQNVRASCWDAEGMNMRAWQALERPEYFELYPLPSSQWKAMYQYMLQQRGFAYNKIGVLGMVYGIALKGIKGQGNQAKFCSELCYEAILHYTDLPLPITNPASVSPLLLRRYLKNLGIEALSPSLLNQRL